MRTSTLLTTALFALTSFVSASPPGCLLGAVNTYDDPSDVKAVCSEKDISKTVAKFCGDGAKSAMEALADICNGAGVKVSTNVPTSSGSASATSSGKASATPSGSMIVMPSGNSTSPSMTGSPAKPTGTGAGAGAAAGASGTKTGSPAESTGAAGRMEIGVVAALAGLLAVAL